MYQTPYRDQQYRQQEIMGASPIRLVIMAYDMAIRGCEKKDFQSATKAISALRDALDFDYPEVSVGLFRLYQWCLDSLRQGDYNGAANSLKELRDAWVTAEKQLTASSANRMTAVRAGLAHIAG
jgi:flagellin-specific chaperone FliS